MKIAVNRDWGYAEIPEELKCELEERGVYGNSVRTDPELIAWVESHEEETGLCVFSVPDETSDWSLFDYDGMETLIYVVEGKILSI